MKITKIGLLCIGLVLAACGGDSSSQNKGYTACGNFPDGPKTCQPGQYCADEGFSECELGCLSNDNCLDEQTCVKNPGDPIGVCENNEGGSCGDGMCGAGETSANCPADCGNNACNGTCEPADLDACLPDCDRDLRTACKVECDDYDFFGCGAYANIQACYDDCETASLEDILKFGNCADAVNCDNSCFMYIK